ncbi:hypothetical protein [Microcoleus sp. F4-D5]|uniref:hypothetical protein n=1 Tax=Microcoleus sp. F4-D5 TaxID=2818760 RepID=UPI002FD592F2
MNANVASSLLTGTLAPDRNTPYFKITSGSIALLISSVIVLRRVRYLSRSIEVLHCNYNIINSYAV